MNQGRTKESSRAGIQAFSELQERVQKALMLPTFSTTHDASKLVTQNDTAKSVPNAGSSPESARPRHQPNWTVWNNRPLVSLFSAVCMVHNGLDVTLVTGWPMVGYWIQRTSGDIPLRARLQKLGVRMHAESAVIAWKGDSAVIRNMLDGSATTVEADSLVLACTNESQTWLGDALRQEGVAHFSVGDCVAPRLAVHAIYEGRELGLRL